MLADWSRPGLSCIWERAVTSLIWLLILQENYYNKPESGYLYRFFHPCSKGGNSPSIVAITDSSSFFLVRIVCTGQAIMSLAG